MWYKVERGIRKGLKGISLSGSLNADNEQRAISEFNRIWYQCGENLSRYRPATARPLTAEEIAEIEGTQGGNPEHQEQIAQDTAATVTVEGLGVIDTNTGEVIMSMYKDQVNDTDTVTVEQAPSMASNVVAIYEAPAAQPVAASPLDLPVEVFRAGLDRRRENRTALMRWVRESLVEGVDYGSIKTSRGPSKPSLMKPGAEKICGMLGVSVAFPTLADYEQAALKGIELKSIIIRCEIRDASGRVVADGVGARSIAQDKGDINKALKMAEKSAHIDATLRLAGLSEVFTQDIEDMQLGGQEQAQRPQQPAPGPRPAPAPTQPRPVISPEQFRHLIATIKAYGLDKSRVETWIIKSCKVGFADLTPIQYEKVMVKIARLAVETGTASPDSLLSQAEELRIMAQKMREGAQYADGQAYHDAMREADDMAARSAQLARMGEQMDTALQMAKAAA